MSKLTAFLAGLIFGLGLLLAGMANPAKVLGFLDLTGAWDPSLALVMAGAIAVALLPFTLAKKTPAVAAGLAHAAAEQARDRPPADRWQPAVRYRLGYRRDLPWAGRSHFADWPLAGAAIRDHHAAGHGLV